MCMWKLDKAKLLYHPGIDIHDGDDSLFMLVCMFGHLDVAKWLYNILALDRIVLLIFIIIMGKHLYRVVVKVI